MIDWHRDGDRMFAMWADPVHQYRVNLLLKVGAKVPLHTHRYDHTLMVPAGLLRVRVIPPDAPSYAKMIGAPHLRPADGCHLHIPASFKHELELVAMDEGVPGSAWCVFPKERFG